MYLFFDTETTGLPKNWKAPVTDLANWPRMIQLAWLLADAEGKKLAGGEFIIKPEGFTIPEEAARIHGITTERALREGRDLLPVLKEFHEALGRADCVVAHNISFDEKIMGAEFLRNGLPDTLPAKTRVCTMHSSTQYCAIPGPYGLKWPKLEELHRKLFQTGFEAAHNAAADVAATIKCFWELKRLGVIKA
ncbi:MAG: DNA polymerase III subunit epsilon [Elusimicrobia bacterium GWA2_61_42]|nr:MAG: DNA polymerase III subunit epsilon [Elusimicrobia bacterium GWA2_61_42]OGR74522.1 MAG: DNA polymerase III subunit epsilon [Elusimicrobia bacterium GWC2_61_25]